MQPLNQAIMEYARKLPEGAPLVAKGFLHLGKRAAVGQALRRLAAQGELIRATRGLYFLPVKTKYGMANPLVEKVIDGLSIAMCETIVPSGAATANFLGLSTQMPAHYVFLTSGRSRKLHLDKQVIELRHAKPWQLIPGGEGHAIRAIEWLGEGETDNAMRKLKRILPPREFVRIGLATPSLPPKLALSILIAMYGDRRKEFRRDRTRRRGLLGA